MPKKILDRDVNKRGNSLSGIKVAVAVCGGIGSVEAVKIIRELRRRGAETVAYMTPSAKLFITPLSLEWASLHPTVVEDGARAEHLFEFEVVLVSPATLNTLAKAAQGIADNVVLSLLATQFGRRGKVYFVPTMNEAMSGHPLFNGIEKTLKSWGAKFFKSEVDEGRIKMPDPVRLVDWIEKELR